ncbi:MAG TPA: ParB/RepB/Spo0J family partition protein [Solirubrobacterales bacterium]|nr:ParB/RepB/Spo0J family partition protein [Solirubrobacterales bacterium]
MGQLITPMLDIDSIEIEEGFNVRKRTDKKKLERMAGSIQQHELVQPISVSRGKGGKYIVVDGHRRFAAAKLAGKKEVPVVVFNGKSRKAASLIANLHREDLNDIEIAEGLRDLAAEESLKTKAEIADKVDFSASWVGDLLRLLKLPAGVQSHIATGDVPVKAERVLRDIAKVSPRIAECVCELAKREKVEAADFVRLVPDLLAAVPHREFKDKPVMLATSGARLDSLIVTDEKKLRDLGDRYLAAYPWVRTNNPTIDFNSDEVDAARALGCLLELKVSVGEGEGSIAFITDQEVAADLAERHVERREKEAAQKRKQQEEEEAERAAQSDARKAEKKAKKEEDGGPSPYEERMAKQAAARTWNQDVGHELVAKKDAGSVKANALNRAKALILTHIADNKGIGCGLRLVKSQLQEVEHRQLKTTGKDKEEVEYATVEEAREWLEKRVEMARTPEEALDIWAEAMAAVVHADEHELPQSKRVYRERPNAFTVREVLKDELKAVRPRRRRTTNNKK